MSNSSGPTMPVPAHGAVVLDLYPRAEVNPRRIAPAGRGFGIDDGHALEPLAQKSHPPVDFVQALLAVGVLGVLRAVALSGGLSHGLRSLAALVMPQPIQLLPQPAGAFGGDVLRTGRGGGRYLDTVQYLDIQGRELVAGPIAID